MSNENTCFYCKKDQRLNDLMIKVCDLEASTIYLFKEQTYRGRCIVAYKGHVNELYELEDKELIAYIKDVTKAANAIKKAFSPDKINYGAYSDKLPHLHFHIVPKYEDDYSWGGVFEMNPQKTYLGEEEYIQRINLIKENL